MVASLSKGVAFLNLRTVLSAIILVSQAVLIQNFIPIASSC